MFLKVILRDKVKNFAALIALIPALRILNLKGDILESYRYISPDSLDWIIQGRIIGSDGIVIPVLRNSGYVLVSKVDWILGAHGLSFAIVSFLGLYLQAFVLIELMKSYRIGVKLQIFGVALFFLIFIHFISLYILPDGIAVGLICIGLHLSLQGLQTARNAKWSVGLILGIIATTFQIYAFSIFLCLILGITLSGSSKKMKIRRFCEVVFAILISLLIIRIWRDWNAHLTVPSQINLLKNSFEMFPFYGHTLTLIFLPLFLISVIAVCLPKVKINILTSQKLYFLVGASLITVAMFYQWPESRFTYSGVALIYIAILPIALKTIDSYMNQKADRQMNAKAIQALLVSILTIFMLFGPSNPWQPRWDQIQIGQTWPNEVLYDYSNDVKSSYRDILREIKDDCFNNSSPAVKRATISKYGRSEYEVSQLDLYAGYCLFK